MNRMRTALLLAFMTALFLSVGFLVGGRAGLVVALITAGTVNLLSYWRSDRLVLSIYGAQEVDARTAPEFVRIVRDLSQRAGLPMPRVYIFENPQPNAFATGRDPQNAAVAASTGLLQALTPEEVAGVMAHELAHIEHRDTLIMTITATLAGAVAMLGNLAFFLGGRRDGNGNGAGVVGTLLAILVAPFAAMLIQMAISRTREYAADRRGGEICGHPLWLASALARIAGAALPNATAERHPATAHLFILNPLSGTRLDRLFSTHPATQDRIAALYHQAEGEDGRDTQLPADGPWGRAGRAARPSTDDNRDARGRPRPRSVPTVGTVGRPDDDAPKGPWT